MYESPLFWPAYFKGDVLYVLDETAIPQKLQYIPVKTTAQSVKVIRDMKTRAFGQLLVVLSTFVLVLNKAKSKTDEQLLALVQDTAQTLNSSRPTFPFAEVTGMVVAWAQQALIAKKSLREVLGGSINGYLQGIRARRIARVENIAQLIVDQDKVLTHCNVSGELAMAAVLCREQKKDVAFYCTETRPYFQGSKLTYWELAKAKAKVTLVADNAIASLMMKKMVNKVIVGSDRNCANGDFANKIGTYQIAVLAKEFAVPFYVLTQPSNRIQTAAEIPIEIRPEKELLYFGGRKTVSGQVKGLYPGFDLVGHELITGSIAINTR